MEHLSAQAGPLERPLEPLELLEPLERQLRCLQLWLDFGRHQDYPVARSLQWDLHWSGWPQYLVLSQLDGHPASRVALLLEPSAVLRCQLRSPLLAADLWMWLVPLPAEH